MTTPNRIITVNIGGQDHEVLEDTLVIESILGQVVDTADFVVFDKQANITIPTLRDVIITRKTVNENGVVIPRRIFGGLISYITGRPEGIHRYWDMSCQDYTLLLDRSLVLNRYAAGITYDGLTGDKGLIARIFETGVLQATGGLGASEILARTYVDQGLTSLTQQDFRYATLREVVSQLAQYVGYDFYVDYGRSIREVWEQNPTNTALRNRIDMLLGGSSSIPIANVPSDIRDLMAPQLHYFYREDFDAPYSLTDGPETSGSVPAVNYRNCEWKRDGTRVVNTFALFGDRLLADQSTAVIRGNGAQKEYELGHASLGRDVVIIPLPGEDTIDVAVNAQSNRSLTQTTHTGPNNATVLRNNSATYVSDGVVIGDIVLNTTDGSWGEVTALTQTTITAALRQGTDNVWDSGDGVEIPTWRSIRVNNDTTTEDFEGADAKHKPLEKTLEFKVAPPNNRAAIRIRYTFSFVGAHYDTDIQSVGRYNRVFARRVIASDVNTAQGLVQKMQWMLEQYANALEVVTLKISDSMFPAGDYRRFEAGQWVSFTNNKLGVIDRDLLIHRVTTRVLGGTELEYELECRNWEVDIL